MPDEAPPVVPAAPAAAATPATTLSADQQKIASALSSGSELTPAGEKKPVQPKVHKAIFKAPPGELLEKEFTVDDESPEDLKGEDDVDIQAKPKADTKKPAVPPVKPAESTTKKTDTVVDAVEPVVKAADATKKTTDIVVDPKGTKAFDYTGYSAEEVSALKQMSTAARDFTVKALKEVKRLTTEQPTAYYQHPGAFQLLPEYQEVQTNISYADKEHQFWKQQLINIRKGQPWHNLAGWDDKGNAVLEGPFKADEDAEINVSGVFNGVGQQVNAMRQQAATIQQGFQKRIQTGQAVLEAERAKRFEWVTNPALLEEKIELPGVGEVALKTIRDDFQKMFDTYHHTNPLMPLAQDMFTALQVYGAKIRNLEASNQHEKTIKEDALRMEPSTDTTAGGGKSEVEDFNTDGLPT